MRAYSGRDRNRKRGSILPLVVIVAAILIIIGIGLLTVAYGMRLRAIRFKNQTTAMLAAEAGYEQGIFWMNTQADVLTSLFNNAPGSSGTIPFGASNCTYLVQFHNFTGGMPVYRIISTGTCADEQRVVDVFVVQTISGWDMGKCRIPDGFSSTEPVYFADTEIINIPVHINNLKDNPDGRDIYISGSPTFRQRVEMGESKGNKYPDSIMNLFNGGIYFDQPDVRITDEAAVDAKVARFESFTAPAYTFGTTGPVNVQLEFFVEGGVGKIRITPNCNVQTHPGSGGRDYVIVSGSGGTQYQQYNIYNYHLLPLNPTQSTVPITDTYVSQQIGGFTSEKGGQIYVNGNVIIGGNGAGLPGTPDNQIVKGKITVVATGNIWVGDSILVDDAGGTQRDASGMPTIDNPNVLGLITKGVVKVIDPGTSNSFHTDYPGWPTTPLPGGQTYTSVANDDGSGTIYSRRLSDPTIIEAAITVGGGGWGAENVGNRKEFSGPQDDLIVHGAICEVIRGVVGVIGSDGYLKHYYLDRRLLNGILPGNIWFSGKYVPAPAGWHDYRPTN